MVKPDLAQLRRIQVVVDAVVDELLPGPLVVALYENARAACAEALEQTGIAREVELLFPEVLAGYDEDPAEYAAILLRQLAAWLRAWREPAVAASAAPEALSPELVLVDPSLRAYAAAVEAAPQQQPAPPPEVRAPAPEPRAARLAPRPVAAAAYVAFAAMRTIAIDVAFLLGVAVLVLILSAR